VKIDDKKTTRRRRVAAAATGIVLYVACQFVPDDYRAVCETLATLCTGGQR